VEATTDTAGETEDAGAKNYAQVEIKLVEEEIAAVLSGESEVLKEHNVLGCVPFNFCPFPSSTPL